MGESNRKKNGLCDATKTSSRVESKFTQNAFITSLKCARLQHAAIAQLKYLKTSDFLYSLLRQRRPRPPSTVRLCLITKENLGVTHPLVFVLTVVTTTVSFLRNALRSIQGTPKACKQLNSFLEQATYCYPARWMENAKYGMY